MPTYEAYAWIYVTDGESGETIRKIVFTIESRAKPTAGVPEPKQDEFLEEVRKIMSDTKEIAQSVRDDADNGEFDGEQGPPGPEGPQGIQGNPGEGGVGQATEDGEIFNDYENNQAIAPFSSASGTNTLAGSKAFTVEDVFIEDVEDSKYSVDFAKKSVKDLTDFVSVKFDSSNGYELVEGVPYDHWFNGTEDVDEYGRNTGYKDESISTYQGNRSEGLKPLTGISKPYRYMLYYLKDNLIYQGNNFEVASEVCSNLARDGIAFGTPGLYPIEKATQVAGIYFLGSSTGGRLLLTGAFDYNTRKVIDSSGNDITSTCFNDGTNGFTFVERTVARGEVFKLHVKKIGKTMSVWAEGYEPVLTIELLPTMPEDLSVALLSHGACAGGGFETFDFKEFKVGYTLDSTEGLAVGDVYSAHIAYEDGSNTQGENEGKVVEIDENRVYVDKLFCEGTFSNKVSHIAQIVRVESKVTDDNISLKFEDGKVFVCKEDWQEDVTHEAMDMTDSFVSYKFDKANGYQCIEEAPASSHWSLGSYGLRSRYKDVDKIATKLGLAEKDCFEMNVDMYYGQTIGVSLGDFDEYPKRTSNSAFVSFANHRIQLSGAFDYNTVVVEGVKSSKFSVYNGTTGIFYFTDNFKGDPNKLYTLNVRRVKDVVTIWVTGYPGILTIALYGCVKNGVSLMANRYDDSGGSFRQVTFKDLESAHYYVLDNEKNSFRIVNKPLTGTRTLGYGAETGGRSSNALLKSSDAGGERTWAYGSYAFTRGCNTQAGYAASSTGKDCKSKGFYSRTHGLGLIATRKCQEVTGSYNKEDTEKKYLEIVGNGKSENSRSNARTLDEDGNAWYAGSVEAPEMFLRSQNGTRFKITVTDDGTLVTRKEEAE